MTFDVTVFVDDVSILVNGTAYKTFGITLDDNTHGIAILILNHAVFDHDTAFKAGERSFRFSFTFVLGDDLTATDNFSRVVPDLAFSITLLASEFLGIALYKAADRDTFRTDDVALFVDRQPLEDLGV